MKNYTEFKKSLCLMPHSFSIQEAINVGVKYNLNRENVLQVLSELCSSGLMTCRDGIVSHIKYSAEIKNKNSYINI